jgi:hypothetical protein
MSAAVQALRAGTVPTAKGAGELSVVSGMRSEFEPLQIEAQLNSLVGTLLGSVVWLDTDVFEILSAAHRRSASNLRPASKGKRERPDCLIIESYFALCRRLRAEGFFGKAVFVSANKNDFCAEGLPLTFHADLAEPCSECGIEFAINFGHALSILDRA